MVEKTKGNAFQTNVKVDWFESYKVYTTLDIKTTKEPNDIGQSNFNRIVQLISFRALPVQIKDSEFVPVLSQAGAPTLTGPGYMFEFGVEQENVFENFSNSGTIGPVGYLVDDLHNLVLQDNKLVQTKGANKNTEFIKL